MKIKEFYFDILKKNKTVKQKAKFILRSIFCFYSQYKLTIFIINNKNLSLKKESHQKIISKLHKPYLQKKFKNKDKLNAIIENYIFFDKFFPEFVKTKLLSNNSLKIVSFCGSNNEKYSVKLVLLPDYLKEGEFSLILKNSNEIILSTLTFSFIKNKEYCLFIGGVQGLKKEVDHILIKESTKDMYGLFPKKLLIEVLYIFLEMLDINIQIIGVGNKTHPFNSLRYKTNIKIYSDYDEFFKSLGAKKNRNGLWELPEKILKKTTVEIPSKKRSLYNKRYKLLDEIKKNLKKEIYSNI